MSGDTDRTPPLATMRKIIAAHQGDPADQPYAPNRKARRAQAKVDRKAPVLQYVGKRVLG